MTLRPIRWAPVAALTGCPWVPYDEHRQNHSLLEQLDQDVTDADTDTDTDADADTDADVDAPCVDDEWEANDTLLTPAEIGVPTVIEPILCHENVSPVFGYPLDLFRLDIGPLEVLDLSLSSDDVACGDLELGMVVTDDQGTPFPGTSTQGGCPTLQVGWGADAYLVWISGEQAPTLDQPYTLTLDSHTCEDDDGDGYLAGACGGPDCSDADGYRYPGATETPIDGTDQDCDGGDDFGVCTAGSVVLSSAEVATGTLPCGDLVTGAVWDRWSVDTPAPMPAGLSIVVQNDAVGAADVVAFVVDGAGTHYGLDPSRGELDDEIACEVPAWTGQTAACPGECVDIASPGQPVELWVAQHPGSGCYDGAKYTLVVNANLDAVLPTSLADDVKLSW